MLVWSAYEHYTPLLGRLPLTMLVDYAQAVRDREVWVLERSGELLGVIELVLHPDHLWVENVAIAPAYQGAGHGRMLLGHAESEARAAGVSEVRLLTNERYTANIAMYTRYGYVESHRVPYAGTDLVHFRKRL
ncbi:MAG: GNAT family N-acetyltransferase [Gaiellales bacterium]